jgi:hypothetical protein
MWTLKTPGVRISVIYMDIENTSCSDVTHPWSDGDSRAYFLALHPNHFSLKTTSL